MQRTRAGRKSRLVRPAARRIFVPERMTMPRTVLQLGFCLVLSAGTAQLPEDFATNLAHMQLDLLEPLDGDYQQKRVFDNAVQRFDYRLRSKYDDLDVRFLLLPYDARRPQTTMPHVETGRIVMNLAVNEAEEVVAQRALSDEVLARTNADWGMEFYLRPKPGFTENYVFTRVVSLYREGRGTVLMFVLFNDPGNRALDRTFDWLRFMDEPRPARAEPN